MIEIIEYTETYQPVPIITIFQALWEMRFMFAILICILIIVTLLGVAASYWQNKTKVVKELSKEK